MSKNVKTALIVGGLLVAAYLVYRWYESKQSGTTGGSLGANLNSVAPEMLGGSTGPSSGLTYNAAPTTVNLTLPNGQTSTSTVTPTLSLKPTTSYAG